MDTKVQKRVQATRLRRQGKSYQEIMAKVGVSKGTLSRWLRDIPLTKKEAKFLRERTIILQDNGRLKTALKNKEQSERRRDRARLKAKVDFERYREDPFFTLGLSLYWTQGSFSDDYFSFTTSDAAMLKLMMSWATQFLDVEPAEYKFRLYTAKFTKNKNVERVWSRAAAIPRSQFQKTIYITNSLRARNDKDYKGSLRMIFPGAEHLVTIKAWQKQLSEYYVETQ